MDYKTNSWKTYANKMSVFVDTTYRSDETEIMDDFSLKGPLLRDTLDKIATINKFLGGNNVTINGLKSILKNHPKDKQVTIIDLGCGGGDILRDIAKLGRKLGYTFKLIGIDANADTMEYARQLSEDYPELRFEQVDIFSEEFKLLEFDIALATLFFHHFKEPELVAFLSKLVSQAKLGVVVNDLHRNRLAYYLYKLITLPVDNEMIVKDGLVSVLRGFKKKDLVQMSEKLQVKYQIKWKWAFRYQWILTRE